MDQIREQYSAESSHLIWYLKQKNKAKSFASNFGQQLAGTGQLFSSAVLQIGLKNISYLSTSDSNVTEGRDFHKTAEYAGIPSECNVLCRSLAAA
jgi:hypothetical protein